MTGMNTLLDTLDYFGFIFLELAAFFLSIITAISLILQYNSPGEIRQISFRSERIPDGRTARKHHAVLRLLDHSADAGTVECRGCRRSGSDICAGLSSAQSGHRRHGLDIDGMEGVSDLLFSLLLFGNGGRMADECISCGTICA